MYKVYDRSHRCRGKNMSCHLIPNSFDRSSYLLFVFGEEIRILFTFAKIRERGIYEDATFGISYRQILFLEMLKTSVSGLW